MARYVAFLRAVSPMNAKMPELKRCFEADLSAYVPSPRGPVFMTLIDNTFGKTVTTRRKCATA